MKLKYKINYTCVIRIHMSCTYIIADDCSRAHSGDCLFYRALIIYVENDRGPRETRGRRTGWREGCGGSGGKGEKERWMGR